MPDVIFGKNPVIECLKAKRRSVKEVYLLGRNGRFVDETYAEQLSALGARLQAVDKNRLESLALGGVHQGVVAVVGGYPYVELEKIIQKFKERAFILICDSIQDPQNLGAICRSALCFGVDAILINKDQSAEINATVVKASAGAVEHLLISRVTNLARSIEELKENGFWIYATDLTARTPLGQLEASPKSAVILGSEGKGVRRLVKEKSDFTFIIPMAGTFDSLNVAQAASVICYEIGKMIHKESAQSASSQSAAEKIQQTGENGPTS